MNYQLAHDLLNLLQQYEEQHSSMPGHQPDMQSFLVWARNNVWSEQHSTSDPNAYAANSSGADNVAGLPDLSANAKAGQAPTEHHSHVGYGRYGGMPDAASAIGRLVIVLGRYAKKYSRLAVADTPFSTIDELTFLAGAMRKPGVSKMELIEMNTQEKPIGMEIIRRLLSLGFLDQGAHPEDKRSQALFCTPAGQQAFFTHLPRMTEIGRMVVGDLNLEQQDQLYDLLQQLDAFHLPVYENRKVDTFDRLLEAMEERRN